MKPEFEKIQNQPLHSFITKTVERTKRPTLKEAWHFHPEIEICFTLKSEGKRFVGNDISDYLVDDVVMFGANLPHGFITEMESEQIVIQMQEGFLGLQFLEKPETQVIKELFIRAKRGIQFYGKTQQKAKRLAKQILKLDGFSKILKLLGLLNYLATSNEYSFITNQSFQANTKMTELKRIQVVYNYVLENYQHKISLDEAAQLVSMTKSSFCRFLKKHTKKTFSEIVNSIRIDHACSLIINTHKNISTIGYESGFNDISYFSRTFKSLTGQNPKIFMLKHRDKIQVNENPSLSQNVILPKFK